MVGVRFFDVEDIGRDRQLQNKKEEDGMPEAADPLGMEPFSFTMLYINVLKGRDSTKTLLHSQHWAQQSLHVNAFAPEIEEAL